MGYGCLFLEDRCFYCLMVVGGLWLAFFRRSVFLLSYGGRWAMAVSLSKKRYCVVLGWLCLFLCSLGAVCLFIKCDLMFSYLKVEQKADLMLVTLSNPKQLNALTEGLLGELEEVVEGLYDQKALRGVVIKGEGKQAFAAGADISAFVDLTPEGAEVFARRGQRVFARIEDAPVPVVAAVRGFALGGGCELAMACHLRVAAPSARFGQPEVKLGLIPGYGGTQRLVQLIGKTKAMEWILGGAIYGAEEALRLGLVNQVVDSEEALEPYALELLERTKVGSPEAISAAISAVNQAARAVNYEQEARSFALCAGTTNFREGTRAFLEKRAPSFTPRS